MALKDRYMGKFFTQFLDQEVITIGLVTTELSIARKKALAMLKEAEQSGLLKLKLGRKGRETRAIFHAPESFRLTIQNSLRDELNIIAVRDVYNKVLSEGAWPMMGFASLEQAVTNIAIDKLEISEKLAAELFNKVDASYTEVTELSVADQLAEHIEQLKKLSGAKEVVLKF
jgi:hypothetical protein